MSNLTKSLTITPTAGGKPGVCSVTADQKHVGWVIPAHDNLTWIAVNICGDEFVDFPTKIDAAAYISNN